MNVRIKYKSAAAAQAAASRLPVACKFLIITDKTTDAYLEVNESFEDYVIKYLNPKNF